VGENRAAMRLVQYRADSDTIKASRIREGG